MKSISKNAKKGFTLVELIVVVAILGILAAITIPRFSQYVAQAKWEATNANAMTVYKAMATVENDLINEGIIKTQVPTGAAYGQYFTSVNDTFKERVQAIVPSTLKIRTLYNPGTHKPEDDSDTYYINYNTPDNPDRTPYGALTVGIKLTNWTNPDGFTSPTTTFSWVDGVYALPYKPY